MTDEKSSLPEACADLRTASEYKKDRPVGAVRFELEDLRRHPYLLPPRSKPLALIGKTEAEVRAVLEVLHASRKERVVHYPDETWRSSFSAETGSPTRIRLWEPSRSVVRALTEYPHQGQRGSKALEIACGSGRNAAYLALHGYRVTAIDRLPDALEKAQEIAMRSGVTIQTLELDLEEPGILHALSADFIVVVRYLDRGLFAAIQKTLVPGGLLVYETFTKAQAVLGHPRNPRFLLEPGELAKAFPQLQTLSYQEGLFDGAHLASLIAQKPISATS